MDRLPALTAITVITPTPAHLTAITDRHGSQTAFLSVPAPGTVGDGDHGAGAVGAAGAGAAVGVGVVEAGATDAAAITAGAVLPVVASRDVASPDAALPGAVRLAEASTVEAVSTEVEVFTVAGAVTGAEAVTAKPGSPGMALIISGWRKAPAIFFCDFS